MKSPAAPDIAIALDGQPQRLPAGTTLADVVAQAGHAPEAVSIAVTGDDGDNGEGIKNAAGKWVYPPLWGDDSFNIGAGMARTYTAAAFVKRNMPIAFRDKFPLGQGGLSDQEAVDVAEYFTHMPRPDFAGKVKDWPKDKKPADARY